MLAMLPWTLLFLAGLLEVGWAAGLKQSVGFTRLWPSIFTLVTMAGSFLLLAYAMRSLPLGTAYAVWTGIGTVGAAILGIMLFGEAATPARILCIGLILAGIAGLKLTS
jgi:quaternary ammonium compound-resistance protein SugE